MFIFQKADLTLAEAKVLASHSEMNGEAEPENAAVLQATVNRLQGDMTELQHKLDQQKEEVRLYKQKYEDTCKQLTIAVRRIFFYSSSVNLMYCVNGIV